MTASTIRYEERLGASGLLWTFLLILSGSLGLAYGAALGTVWGVVTFVVVQGAGSLWLAGSRARILVDDDDFVAGRARLPLEFVGNVVALDGDETRHAAGPGADARAYLLLRGASSSAVKVVLNDPADPTPYWLIVTRRPSQLRDAILAARDAKVARGA